MIGCKYIAEALPKELRVEKLQGTALWLVWTLVIAGIAKKLTVWIANKFATPLDFCFSLLQDSPLTKWTLLIIFILYGSRLLTIAANSKHLHPKMIISAGLAIVYISAWPGSWLTWQIGADDALHFRFLLSWVLMLGLILLITIFSIAIITQLLQNIKKLLQTQCRSEENTDAAEDIKMPGIPVQAPEYYDDGRKEFASTVADIVAETNLREEPLTLGITGEWGAGKSLVLNEVRKCLEKKELDVIEFFPWQSTSPSNLIEDFFKTMSAKLHSRSRRLGSALESYADKLITLDLDKRLNALARIGRFIGGGYVSIQSARGRIQEDLQGLKRSVVVIIDDLDRLDSDELFETLRLIRNTAHFRNMAYILAYDKEYVISMLTKKGIEDAERYLEKIFKLTLPLPAFEGYTYAGVMMRQVRRKYANNSTEYRQLANMIMTYYPSRPKLLINNFVKNYRQAISLSSFLIMQLEILKKGMPNYVLNISTSEWFSLQILSFFYHKIYIQLKENPVFLLDFSQGIRGERYYRLNEERLVKFLEDSRLKKEEDNITYLLKSLFGHRNNPPAYSIIYPENFHNYFANRILKTEVSESEFIRLLSDESADIISTLTEWAERKPSVKESISNHFIKRKITDFTGISAKRYIEAMLLWLDMAGDQNYRSVLNALKEITLVSYQEEPFKTAEEAFKEVLGNIINESECEWDRLCEIVMAQTPYPEDPTDPENDQAYCFLTKAEAEKLIDKIIKKAVIEGDIHHVDDISNPNSTTCRILNASYKETQVHEEPDCYVIENYAIRPLIDCLQDLTIHDPNAIGKDLQRLIDTYAAKDSEDPELSADASEAADRRIKEIFGNSQNLRYIIEDLYDAPEAEKEEAIKKLS